MDITGLEKEMKASLPYIEHGWLEALLFNRVSHSDVPLSTPHSSRFARLVSAAFSKASSLDESRVLIIQMRGKEYYAKT
jgi:hypothetical protein